MKPSYSSFRSEEKKTFIDVPPVGAYPAEILNVRFVSAADKGNFMKRDYIELYIDISEGEYRNRYMEVWNSQKERFGGDVKYKGTFRLVPPTDDDEPWRKTNFQDAIWRIEQSNPGFAWDWHEEKLAKKFIGINVRQRFYTYNGTDKETTEIGQLEIYQDVLDGKCKTMKPRDNRQGGGAAASTDAPVFTEVSAEVDVPW